MSERKVATDALESLGTILDETQKRDAIHLAVEPVTAGETLKPGEHITVENGVARKTAFGKGLGIVDPFLTEKVRQGQRFWFVMYPRMVHSLRHVWTHPNFPDEPLFAANHKHTKQESEAWLRNFCASSDCPGFDTVMELISTGSVGGDGETYGRYDSDYLHFGGEDAHGEIPLEFWVHAENYLGRKLSDHPTSFSCSC